MSEGKRDTERPVAQAETAQDAGLQGLRTEVSDFQNKLLAPLSAPRDAFSSSSRAKTEPVATRHVLNGAAPSRAAPRQGTWAPPVLTSDDLLQMTQRAVELSITPRLLMLENKLTGLEVRLEGLTDKLDFAQEDIGLQLQEVKDDLHRTRIAMDATQGWMENKDYEE